MASHLLHKNVLLERPGKGRGSWGLSIEISRSYELREKLFSLWQPHKTPFAIQQQPEGSLGLAVIKDVAKSIMPKRLSVQTIHYSMGWHAAIVRGWWFICLLENIFQNETLTSFFAKPDMAIVFIKAVGAEWFATWTPKWWTWGDYFSIYFWRQVSPNEQL